MAAATTTTPSTASERRYRPVVIVHGLMTGDVSTMEHLAARITELHPGTRTYVIDRFCGLASLEPLWRQTKLLGLDLLQICSLHPEGVHVIGYSQGGLIARGMIEHFGVEHNVKTFVSLSSPQGGQFGAECFTKMFPALTARTAYEVFYTRLGQHSLSVANYWYDPRHRDLYIEYSAYLAVIDNLKQSELTNHDLDYCRPPDDKDDDDDAVSSTTTAPLRSKTSGDVVGSSSDGGASSEPVVYRTADSASSSSLGTSLEVRIAVAIAKVSAATVKVAEGHGADDDYSDADSVSIAVDTTTADFSDEELGSTMHTSIPIWNGTCFDSDDFIGRFHASGRKLGLTRLQRLVLIGGPDDGVISPCQSSHFGVLDSSGDLIPLRERRQNDVYSEEDIIGLRQLDDTGRLIEYTVPGVGHHEWHRNEKVLQDCIINWLD